MAIESTTSDRSGATLRGIGAGAGASLNPAANVAANGREGSDRPDFGSALMQARGDASRTQERLLHDARSQRADDERRTAERRDVERNNHARAQERDRSAQRNDAERGASRRAEAGRAEANRAATSRSEVAHDARRSVSLRADHAGGDAERTGKPARMAGMQDAAASANAASSRSDAPSARAKAGPAAASEHAAESVKVQPAPTIAGQDAPPEVLRAIGMAATGSGAAAGGATGAAGANPMMDDAQASDPAEADGRIPGASANAGASTANATAVSGGVATARLLSSGSAPGAAPGADPAAEGSTNGRHVAAGVNSVEGKPTADKDSGHEGAAKAESFAESFSTVRLAGAAGEQSSRAGAPAEPTFALSQPHAAAPQLHATPSPATAAPQTSGAWQAHVPVPVGHPGFAGSFAGEIASFAMKGIERAEITLFPKELGPVKIELSVSGNSARVAFAATTLETRQAIEQSLPVLESMLSQHGLQLAGSSVSDGGADPRMAGGGSGSQPGANGDGGSGAASAATGSSSADAERPVSAQRSNALLDLFA